MRANRSTTRWPLVPLGTLAEFRNGINFSKTNFGSGIKVIGVGDFQSNVRAAFDDLEQINPQGIVRKEHLLKNGDIIFVRSNGNRELIGRSMFVEGLRENVTHSAFSIRLRFLSEACMPRFYGYLFRSRLIRQALSLHGGGTNISNLNQDILGRLEVPLPPKPVQCKIAAILSAYDDLVENNTRRIKVLEGMAKMIYREWFVNFRFPGYVKVKMIQSEMGHVPKGWGVQRVTEAIEVDPMTKVPKQGMKPFVAMGGLSHTSMLISDIERREGNSGSKFRNGDTLFARITPSLENGKTGFVQFLPDSEAVGFGSTEFIVLRSQTVTPEYVYLMARSDEFRENAIKSMTGASGRQRVQEACFGKFLIAHPPADLLQSFQNVVMPMFRLVYALSAKNENLRKTRDMLLPKLISGEISVEHSEADAVRQSV